MATESADQRQSHLRSITVTSLAALAGVAAALVSAALTADVDPARAATLKQPQYVVLAAIFVQLPLLHVLGVDVADFGFKDMLYVAFMTFSLWFVTWGIMLMTGASVPV